MGQERLGPSYFFISSVLGPLNSLAWYVPSLRYTRGPGWRMHCGVEVTESSTNKQHHLSVLDVVADLHVAAPLACAGRYVVLRAERECVRRCGTRAPALPLTNHAPWLHLSELCERVPFINKRTPRAPTKPNNAEAG